MFKAIVLEQSDGEVAATLQEVDEARLPAFVDEGGVTVAIEYTTLNYKDGMILNGIGRLVRKYPRPCRRSRCPAREDSCVPAGRCRSGSCRPCS